MVILGICGFQGAGKDTFANYFVDKHNFIKFTFAGATKDVLNILFGWDRKLLEGDTIESRKFRETEDPWWSEKLGIPNLTPRKTLQLIGTDIFRNHFNSEIWVRVVEKNILKELESNPNSNIIISDCRFSNEFEMLRNLGCKIISIQRNLPSWFNNYKLGNDCEEAIKLHESERSWIREKFDYIIANNLGTKESFEVQICEFIKNNFNLSNTSNTSDKTQGEYLSLQFGLKQLKDTDKKKITWIDSNLVDLIKYQRGFEDFNLESLDKYYLYTGRGPSQGTLHIGHLLGLELIKNLSSQFESKIFFMIADDEKILRDNIDQKTMKSNVSNTIDQLNLIGFNNSNTTFHINSVDIGPREYNLMLKLMSMVSLVELSHIFGKKDNIGEYFYVFYQMVPCFLSPEFQCIVVCGVDQDPFFRLARNLAKRLGYKPPIILYTHNVPGLDGSDKMSTSIPQSNPIFLTDDNNVIKNKIFGIKKVGAGSLNELFDKGADLESDTLIKLARLFEPNRQLLHLIEKGYSIGFDNTNTIDLEIIDKLSNLISEKGIVSRGTKTMITTFGVRCYLTNLIIEICSKYNI